jgi:hypothetical protein
MFSQLVQGRVCIATDFIQDGNRWGQHMHQHIFMKRGGDILKYHILYLCQIVIYIYNWSTEKGPLHVIRS